MTVFPVPTAATAAPSHHARRLIIAFVLAAAFALVWVFDRELYLSIRSTNPDITNRAWYQFLRVFGYWPFWIALGLALLAHQWPFWSRASGPNRWAGLFIGLVPGLAAGFGEIIQNIVCRLKPSVTDGVHRYGAGPGVDPAWGFPSSHAAVAFGGAFMLFMFYPRAGIIAIILATGCAWTRVLQGGHFVSDVLASAALAYGWARLLHYAGRRVGVVERVVA